MSNSLINIILPALGGGAAIVISIAAFLYWLIQKSIDSRFAKGLEDYRHAHTAFLQSEKFRLDLYDRRFEIFTSIFEFYDAMISWEGTTQQKDARTRFFRSYQESQFLFSEDSGITALLKNLLDEAAKVTHFKDHSDLYRDDPNFFRKQYDEITDIQLRVFDEGLTKLRSAMRPYLDFSKA